MNADHIAAFSALDLARMLFGVLIVAAGAVSCLFFAVRRKQREYSLLYFGLGAILYGVRLFINGSSGYMDETVGLDHRSDLAGHSHPAASVFYRDHGQALEKACPVVDWDFLRDRRGWHGRAVFGP